MTLRLTVQSSAWRAHVARMATSIDHLVPVVKGNGYGFGRAVLHPLAANLSDHVCVGTVHELDHVPAGITPVVLTPTSIAPSATATASAAAPILTVGAPEHVTALRSWRGPVLIKLRSSMHRFGVEPACLADLRSLVDASPLTPVGYSLHLPLAGSDAERVAEIEAWLPALEADQPLWISHLAPPTFAGLLAAHPHRQFRLRVGTALWHGDKSFLHLSADVLAVSRIMAGDTVGYRHANAPADGHVVVIGAGSAHGVAPLADGASPFHFQRRRLQLLEPPHMHASLVFVPVDEPSPRCGDRVDVQRPLITTLVDTIEWLA
jgi:alanine racemase